MTSKELTFTDTEIETALAKMPAYQRIAVTELADKDMLQYIPTLEEEKIPDCVNDIMVDAIIEALEPYIRDAVMGCTLCLTQYFEPFKQYRRNILEAREGRTDEESR